LHLTALFFLLHPFSPFHNFPASRSIDSSRVPIQAVSYKLYSAKSVSLAAIGVLAEIHNGEGARIQNIRGASGVPMTWSIIGVNYEQIPASRPKSPVHSYSKDGAMRGCVTSETT
jgi:hypothetical protein